jgi:hypothetical protein
MLVGTPEDVLRGDCRVLVRQNAGRVYGTPDEPLAIEE